MQKALRRGLQQTRHSRAWLTRAKRLGGRLQVLAADFQVRLDVHHEYAGTTTSETSTVHGYAHLMISAATLRRLGLSTVPATTSAHQAEDVEEDTAAARDATPDPAKSWWTPGAGYGLTMDYVEKLGGVEDLYNQLVPLMVERGYLPADALPTGTPTGAATPWLRLQELTSAPAQPTGRTGFFLNQPGQDYANWRQLVAQLSEEWLAFRGDDVFAGGHGQPGVTMSFLLPGSQLSAADTLTIGLTAAIRPVHTHQGTHPYTLQYGHTNVDTLTTKKASGQGVDLSGIAGADPPITADWQPRMMLGGQGNWSSGQKRGQAQSTALSSDTDGQSMPTSRYAMNVQWTWDAFVGDAAVPPRAGATRRVDAQLTLLQPDELHTGAHEAPPPPLATHNLSDRKSVLTTIGAAIYTAVGANGVAALQQQLIERAPALSKVDVWTGLTMTVYKTALIRAMSAAATIPLGNQEVTLTVVPLGRPHLVRVWKPYTQQVLEAQVGREAGRDRSRTGGFQGLGGQHSEHFWVDGTTAGSTGSGTGDSGLETVGSYRGVYQDTEMTLVRTVVRNVVTLADGRTVGRLGEVVLNVLLTDVMKHRNEFDDPRNAIDAYHDRLIVAARQKMIAASRGPAGRNALTTLMAATGRRLARQPSAVAPLVRAMTTKLDPPLSLRHGQSWALVWPALFDGGAGEVGLGALNAAIAREARSLGGSELVTALAAVPTWLGPYLAKMRDGGAAWTVSAGGRTFRLAMNARLVGPARDSRAGGTGQKIYERGNSYRDQARKNLTSLSTTVTAAGAFDAAHGAEEAPVRIEPTTTATRRTEESDTRGSNLLFMEGLRANKLTDFTQAVDFSFTLREVTGVIGKVKGIARAVTARPAAVRSATVTEDHVVAVPTEGTVPRGAPLPTYGFSLRPALPSKHRIEGMTGIQAIFDAIKASKSATSLDPLEAVPRDNGINFENLRQTLPAMLTHEGATTSSITTATEVLDLGRAEARVRARFGAIGQIYYMEKAEFENYDHGTDLTSNNRSITRRTTAGVNVTALGPTPAPILMAGGRVRGGTEWGSSVSTDTTDWIEHRAWLRMDSSVFFIYTALHYEITMIHGGRATVFPGVGLVELVTDRAGALALGIPLDTLQSVVPPKHRAKEFGAAAPLPPERTRPVSAPPSHRLTAIVDTFNSTVAALATVTAEGQLALATLEAAGHGETAHRYLAAPDPGERQRVLFQHLSTIQPAFLAATATLTATARTPREIANSLIVQAMSPDLAKNLPAARALVDTAKQDLDTSTKVDWIRQLHTLQHLPHHDSLHLRIIASAIATC